ncbi:hypothetical protein [Polymorphospora rubra]|uniref:N-acetyltransferase domain-containing protein n=1 Tax=Polymorphospora rubra TaxID=338584 RepID=A0A810MVA0_9ACTN|nr:hypothetical protein [Polymorphospora rubra]BCJ65116.1 hypothetical protein Prubr_21370 [Polymorphospora rubra]
MNLTLIEKRQPDKGRFWLSFGESDEFRASWWNKGVQAPSSSSWFEVRDGDLEVARIELDDVVPIEEWAGVPRLGRIALEIQLIEVAASQRHQGIGTEIIRMLAAEFPDRRLVAFSETDRFWASLGWDRHDHAGEPERRRALYIQPASNA